MLLGTNKFKSKSGLDNNRNIMMRKIWDINDSRHPIIRANLDGNTLLSLMKERGGQYIKVNPCDKYLVISPKADFKKHSISRVQKITRRERTLESWQKGPKYT